MRKRPRKKKTFRRPDDWKWRRRNGKAEALYGGYVYRRLWEGTAREETRCYEIRAWGDPDIAHDDCGHGTRLVCELIREAAAKKFKKEVADWDITETWRY